MNRRDLMRTGIVSSIIAEYSRFHEIKGADVPGPSWHPAPSELPPIRKLPEPLIDLKEALAKNLVQAKWLIAEPYRVQVSLKNLSDKRFSVHIEPGTVLVHEKQSWLLGGATKYVGQFGGHFQNLEFGAEWQPVTISLLAGRTSSIVFPTIALSSLSTTPFKQIKDPQVLSVADWTSDSKTSDGLKTLASIGSSMPVAQGIAWRLGQQLGWEKLARQTVEGKPLNQFERQSVDRYLEVMQRMPLDHTLEAVRHELLKDQIAVLVTGFGPKRAAGVKYLTDHIAQTSFMGMPVDRAETSPTTFSKSAGLRLELHVADQVRPGLFAIDASLSSRSGPGGIWMKFAKTRVPIRLEGDTNAWMNTLEAQLAPSVVTLRPVSAGPMTNRFRLENLSPLTLAGLEAMTNSDPSDPALWGITDLGLSSRGRSIVKIPSKSARPVRIRFGII